VECRVMKRGGVSKDIRSTEIAAFWWVPGPGDVWSFFFR